MPPSPDVVKPWRAGQRRGGRMIGARERIVAATAVALGWGVVTGDVAEFEQVEGLVVRGI